MSYRLGIDLGTTFTAAAVCSLDEDVARPEVVSLGSRAAAIPSMAFVAEDDTFVFGESAGRRWVTDPDRVIREFKRRIGDPVPMVAGGVLHEPQDVAARFVESVVEQVAERFGSYPDTVTVTHPAAWGEHKCSLFAEALADRELGGTELMPEPEAAAIAYAADLKVDPGSIVAVYDLGGGTFDAAIVRGHARGNFALAGKAQGLDQLGGADFDEAIFDHVRGLLSESWHQLDVSDPAVLSAVAALRRECTEAKEALSSDTEVTIPVMLPGSHSRVRLTRGEFEDMIVPAVGETLDALEGALRAAGLSAADLSAILLVGGSSRIPIITQSISDQFDLPVVADADPKGTVALGAALSGQTGRAELGQVGLTSTDLTPQRTEVEPISTEQSTDQETTSPVRTYQGRAAVLAGATVLAIAAGTGSLTSGPSPLDGAREVFALPGNVYAGSLGGLGAAESQKAGETALAGGTGGAQAPFGRTGSTARIDPWTGEPVERTTAPGPTRVGATPASGTFDVTDPGPRPPQQPNGQGEHGDGSGPRPRSGRTDTGSAPQQTSGGEKPGTNIGGGSGEPDGGKKGAGKKAGREKGGTEPAGATDTRSATGDGGSTGRTTKQSSGSGGGSRLNESPAPSTTESSTGSTTQPSGRSNSKTDEKIGSGTQNTTTLGGASTTQGGETTASGPDAPSGTASTTPGGGAS